MNLKRLAPFALLAALLQPFELALADPSSAFSRLMNGASMSYSKPGYFASQAEHVYSGGSVDFHVPAESVQLVSITPPSLSAGCNGIDLNLGGFNVISGANFAAFIQAASQAAPGFVIMIGIKTLCPQCAAVLSEIHQLAEEAAKASANSCQAGQWLLSQITGQDAPQNMDSIQQACGQAAPANSAADNPLDAIAGSTCGLLQAAGNAMTSVGGFFQNMSPSQQAQSGIVGNFGWIALVSLGMSNPSDMEFILSMTGTSSSQRSNTVVQQGAGGATGGITTTYYPPTVTDPGEAINLMLCGTSGATSSDTLVQNYCSSVFGGSAQSVPPLWVCVGSTSLDAEGCPFMTFSASGGGVAAAGVGYTGFLLYVHQLLEGALNAVQSNSTLDPQFIALANVAPIPIYKIINIAAVYPDVAAQLVDNSTVLIAELIAEAYMRQIINYGAHTYTTTSTVTSYTPVTEDLAALGQSLVNGQTTDGSQSYVPSSITSGTVSPDVTASSTFSFGDSSLPSGSVPFNDPLTDTGGGGSDQSSVGVPVNPDGSGATVVGMTADTTTGAPTAGSGVVSDGAAANARLARKMQSELQKLDVMLGKTTTKLATMFQLQTSLMAQIADIDRTIQTQVMRSSLAGNGWAAMRMMTTQVQAAGGSTQGAAPGVTATPGVASPF